MHEPTRRAFIGKALVAGISMPTIAAFLEACGGAQSAPASTSTGTMRIASASGPSYFQVISAMDFAEKAKKETGGRLTVTVFPSGQLAGEADSIKGMQLGTIDAYAGSTASSASVVPDLGVLDMPYVFDSAAHYFKVLGGSLGQKLTKSLDDKGIHLIDWWAGGTRDVYHNKRAIEKPADMAGMKLRTIQSPVYVATFKAFGAIPTPLAVGDVFLALKTGTLDGAETALTAAVSLNHDQVVKYASLTHHQFTSAMFACSKIWWDALAKDLQQSIRKVADQVTPSERNSDTSSMNDAITKMKGEGITVVTPDRAAFRAIAQGVWSQFAAQYGQDTIDGIRKQAV
jgi:tripartite ATP-independent transporter DctP family solute receptor